MFSRLEHNGTVSYKCSEESITRGDLVVSHNYFGATVSNLTPTFKTTSCEIWSSFLRDAPPASQRRKTFCTARYKDNLEGTGRCWRNGLL